MKIYTLDYQKNNTEALDEKLRAIFGARYVGMGSSDDGVWFEFNDDGQEGDKARLQDELDAHNPEELSEGQKKRRGKPDLATLRGKIGNPGRQAELLSEILDRLEDLQGGE